MERGLTPDHSAVRRLGAERYLRHTLIWFALTVIAVRSALAATGYPKLGGAELHIAHVLWGGLFLFGAALSPLLFANRWALETSAVQAEGDQGQVTEAVGIELATTLLDFALNRAPRSDFASLASRLPRLGGSHAQRDVFVRTLAEFAANRGDSDALRTILGTVPRSASCTAARPMMRAVRVTGQDPSRWARA